MVIKIAVKISLASLAKTTLSSVPTFYAKSTPKILDAEEAHPSQEAADKMEIIKRLLPEERFLGRQAKIILSTVLMLSEKKGLETLN